MHGELRLKIRTVCNKILPDALRYEIRVTLALIRKVVNMVTSNDQVVIVVQADSFKYRSPIKPNATYRAKLGNAVSGPVRCAYTPGQLSRYSS
jgi:hypothetical protein